MSLTLGKGKPFPLGLSLENQFVNFSIYSKQAISVNLCLFDEKQQLIQDFFLDPKVNKTGNIWHIAVANLPDTFLYGYKLDGNTIFFQKDQILSDPYAQNLNTTSTWGEYHKVPYQPLGVFTKQQPFDWEGVTKPKIPIKDLVIYETHVRGFTIDKSSGVKHPGTFLGIIEKIPFLLDLGINGIELLPIFEFNECDNPFKGPHEEKLYNYWGYSTVNFFTPMNRYATSASPNHALTEFKSLVKELHKNKIEVILDIVLNHTAENGKEGPFFSFKGIDANTYYIINEEGQFANYTGCGNTFNCNHPIVIQFILDVLRFWYEECQVDGFRFDLASIFKRDLSGEPNANALLNAITYDPILSEAKLIAEPWDAAGLYNVGSFYYGENRWVEWNGKFRDRVRQFIKGNNDIKGGFASSVCGSNDIYFTSPLVSQNFICVHDGFTLHDLVSYNEKHNEENGEQNRDGINNNDSWNCGEEGETQDPTITQLRIQQRKNYHLALMISQGVPLLLMGDEYGHSKKGNNNTWSQDNELNWFLWNELKKNEQFYEFYKFCIRLRKQNPLFRSEKFLSEKAIVWLNPDSSPIDWLQNPQFLAFTLIDQIDNKNIYIAFNSSNSGMIVKFPEAPDGKKWYLLIDTGKATGKDFYEEKIFPIDKIEFTLPAYASILLKAL